MKRSRSGRLKKRITRATIKLWWGDK